MTGTGPVNFKQYNLVADKQKKVKAAVTSIEAPAQRNPINESPALLENASNSISLPTNPTPIKPVKPTLKAAEHMELKRSEQTLSKKKNIQKILKSNHWTNKYGVFKKHKTTTAGNCFFSSLLAIKLFDFQCKEDSCRILVERIRNDELVYFSVWKWHVG